MILERLKKLWGKLEKKECEHDWKMESPSTDFGGALQIWDGPVYDYCTKCGERRRHPECQHDWQPVENHSGRVPNGEMVLTAICSICGSKLYERVE